VTDRLLTAREVAELLGFAADTIVDWAEDGRVPCFKIGGRLRFRLSEVEAWVESQRRGPGAGGDVPPTPTATPTRGVLSQVPPTPQRGEADA